MKALSTLLIVVFCCALGINAQQHCDPCSSTPTAYTPTSGGNCFTINTTGACSFANTGVHSASCGVKSAGKFFNTQYRHWIRITVPSSGEFHGTVMPTGNNRSFPKITLFQGSCSLSSGNLVGCAFQSPNSCGGGYTCGNAGTLIATNLGTATYGEQFAMDNLTPGSTVYACIDWLGSGTGGNNQVCLYDYVLTENDITAAPDICGSTISASTSGSLAGFSCASKPPNCGGGPAPSYENVSYFQVKSTTGGTNITITASNTTCTSSNLGIQMLVYQGSTCGLSSCVGGNTASGTANKTVTITSPTPSTIYTIVVDGFAGSLCDFDLTASNCDVLLPVDLISLTGSWDEQNLRVDLDWSTYEIDDLAYFVVERSRGGDDFSAIGNVASAEVRKNHDKFEFEFSDFYPNAENLYRLKFVDLSGTVSYSNMVSVNQVGAEADPVIFATEDHINIRLYSPESDFARVEIMDLTGKLLHVSVNPLQTGSNSLEIPSGNWANGGFVMARITNRRGVFAEKVCLVN